MLENVKDDNLPEVTLQLRKNEPWERDLEDAQSFLKNLYQFQYSFS